MERAINLFGRMIILEIEKDKSLVEIIYKRSPENIRKQVKIGEEMVSVSKEYIGILRENNIDPANVRQAYYESQTNIIRISSKESTSDGFKLDDDQGWFIDDSDDDDSFFDQPLPDFLQKYADEPATYGESEWQTHKKKSSRR